MGKALRHKKRLVTLLPLLLQEIQLQIFVYLVSDDQLLSDLIHFCSVVFIPQIKPNQCRCVPWTFSQKLLKIFLVEVTVLFVCSLFGIFIFSLERGCELCVSFVGEEEVVFTVEGGTAGASLLHAKLLSTAPSWPLYSAASAFAWERQHPVCSCNLMLHKFNVL